MLWFWYFWCLVFSPKPCENWERRKKEESKERGKLIISGICWYHCTLCTILNSSIYSAIGINVAQFSYPPFSFKFHHVSFIWRTDNSKLVMKIVFRGGSRIWHRMGWQRYIFDKFSETNNKWKKKIESVWGPLDPTIVMTLMWILQQFLSVRSYQFITLISLLQPQQTFRIITRCNITSHTLILYCTRMKFASLHFVPSNEWRYHGILNFDSTSEICILFFNFFFCGLLNLLLLLAQLF